jgi:hypothetical protein
MFLSQSGEVGIGTTSPNQKLEVSSSSAPTIRINNTKNGAWTVGEDFGGLEFYGNDASGEGPGVKGYVKLDSTNIYGAAFSMRFGTTDGTNGITERMVITHTGKVGIGTTAPVQKLHIDGGSSNTYLHFSNTDTGSSTSTGADIGITGDEDLIVWNREATNLRLATSGTERIRVNATGNVGIGTTSPAAKLEVEGGEHLLQVSTTSATGNPYISFNQAGTRRSFIQHADNGDFLKLASEYGGISFFTGTGGTETQKMTIDSSGKVGIGTTNPGVYRLNVSGLVKFQTSSLVPGFEVVNTIGGAVQRNIQAEDSSSSIGSECLRLEHAGVDDGNFGLMITFRDSNGNIKGKISSTSTSTTYATSSDQRLKEDPKDFDALNLISQIQPYDFKWKTSGERDFGFYAQELNEVLPQAVDVPTLDDGVTIDEDAMLMADYTKLVPVLVKAIQQLKDKIQTLENQQNK